MDRHHTTPGRVERMTANELAAALAARAEEVCRRYLPRGRKDGWYWKVGNVQGDARRSLFVGLAPSARPGRWTDLATGERGDLLDLLKRRYGDAASNEASRFLAQCGPPVSCRAARRIRDRLTNSHATITHQINGFLLSRE